ncbi:CoA ester lyase [Phyllobacterium sp. YR531]|uniref:HpcH/HpaI aldolase/citrate lyase family protein n=1 Tax=Phyllobacterium sp. YR531 TaxID=1144343 RepID=UPI00026FB1CE|nr:CoA ester lyase [Phyllobacterium sp. YR531]EJN06731.1 citrate lyase beta subunit [Phyllobacterium sp. YR531]
MSVRLRRSALYVPATNARALEKAKSLPSDVIIVDLEDSIAPSEKENARQKAVEILSHGGFGREEVVVRINALSSPWGEADLSAVLAAEPMAILFPKISASRDLQAIAARLEGRNVPEVWAMLETPAAMLRTLEIAEARLDILPQLSTLVIGTNDLAKDTRVSLKPGRASYLPWLMQCVAAARAAGLDILDGVFNDFRNDDGFKVECMDGREIGMDGKTLIHPNQITIANESFAPTVEEVDWARKVCAAFDLPENGTAGVINIEGKMVERLHAEIARRLLQMSAMIEERAWR